MNRQSDERFRGANPNMDEIQAVRSADVSAQFLVPHIGPGMRLLDCGCGAGAITLGLAGVVAPGQVEGIDLDPGRIEAAQQSANAQSVGNVQFQVGDVHDLPFSDGSFDAVYEHALFQHLADPVVAAKEVLRVLKPGGVFGASDRIQTQGVIISSTIAELFLEHFRIRRAVSAELGSDMNVGLKLHTILKAAGFVNVVPSASLEMLVSPEQRARHAKSSIATIRDEKWRQTVFRLGLADEALLDRHIRAFEQYADDPDTWAAGPRGEAIGWKP